jgi:hypothetical protein
MARFTLCFVLLASALGYATPPTAASDSSVVSPKLAGFNLPMAIVSGEAALAGTPNDLARAGEGEGICYKIRAYIFKRDDDRAPRFPPAVHASLKQRVLSGRRREWYRLTETSEQHFLANRNLAKTGIHGGHPGNLAIIRRR